MFISTFPQSVLRPLEAFISCNIRNDSTELNTNFPIIKYSYDFFEVKLQKNFISLAAIKYVVKKQ